VEAHSESHKNTEFMKDDEWLKSMKDTTNDYNKLWHFPLETGTSSLDLDLDYIPGALEHRP